MGIFCKFGSLDANLPVLVAANKKEVWIRFVLEFKCSGKESEYVFFSLLVCLQSNTNLGSSCPLNAKSSNTVALVAKLPFFVFFSEDILSSLYIISPSCLVEPILNFLLEIL